MKQTYSCAADAQEALCRFLKNYRNKFYPLKGQVIKAAEKVKRDKPGRPACNEEPSYRVIYRLNLQVEDLDEGAYWQERQRLSCFVLVSNIFDDYTGYDLLKEYKQQTMVENRFKFVKQSIKYDRV